MQIFRYGSCCRIPKGCSTSILLIFLNYSNSRGIHHLRTSANIIRRSRASFLHLMKPLPTRTRFGDDRSNAQRFFKTTCAGAHGEWRNCCFSSKIYGKIGVAPAGCAISSQTWWCATAVFCKIMPTDEVP